MAPKLVRITTSPLSLKSLLPNQMKYMRQQGFEVLMVSSDGPEWKDITANEGCDHRVVHMTRKITPFQDLVSLWRLYRLFRKEKPDIVHSHTPKAGLLSMLAAKFSGVPVRIHTIAGLRFMTSKGLTRRILVWMEKLTARAANHVWPNSPSLKQYIINHKLAPVKKLAVIGHGSSNGVDLSRYSVSALDKTRLESTASSINFDPACFYLLAMGRIVRDKGIDELVAAFRELYQGNNKIRLILVGTFEDDLDPISIPTKEILKTHPGIIHIEWSNSAEYYMHLAQLMVHASYREGFPSTLLQAGAMGCPIVCSAIEGSVDIVTHNETGLLFEPRNAADLVAKLKLAIGDMENMVGMATVLRKRIEVEFSQPHLYAEMFRNYQNCLNDRPVKNVPR